MDTLKFSQHAAGQACGSSVQAEPIVHQGRGPASGEHADAGFNNALMQVVSQLMVGKGNPRLGQIPLQDESPDETSDKQHHSDTLPLKDDAQQQLMQALLMTKPLQAEPITYAGSAQPLQAALTPQVQSLREGKPAGKGEGIPTLASGADVTLVPEQAQTQLTALPQYMVAPLHITATPAIMAQPVSSGVATPAMLNIAMPGHTSTIKLDTEESRWSQQLSQVLGERLQFQVKNHIQHATIRLDPPAMGKLDISLQLDDGGRVAVQINASHAEVYRALQQTSNDLRQSLTEQNFVQVNVQVSSQSGQRQSQQQPFAQQQDTIVAGDEVTLAMPQSRRLRREDDSVLLTI